MKRTLEDAGAFLVRRAWYRDKSKALAIPRKDDGKRRLLVDVSLIAKSDARTGIQRVVRGVWASLLKQGGNFEIQPVIASRRHGYSAVRYGSDGSFGQPDMAAMPVEVRAGDIFLGLDLSAHLLPIHATQVERWKALGVTIAIVCYDLLPATHPRYFTPRSRTHFAKWIDWVLRSTDAIFTISGDVSGQIAKRIAEHGIAPTPPIHKLRLGGDLMGSIPSRGIAPGDEALLEMLRDQPAMLMVGTIEPRKGYPIALDAFDRLWSQGAPCHLVIVGKAGWKSRTTLARLRQHPQRGKRLHWVEHASDEFLDRLYQTCSGLLVTAYAEGYCLPIVEAARHGLPVLARNIAVLREHGYPNHQFFDRDDAESLAVAILSFMSDSGRAGPIGATPTWDECGEELLCDLGLIPEKSAEQKKHGLESLKMSNRGS